MLFELIYEANEIKMKLFFFPADNWVLDTLSKTHHIPFKTLPTSYYEPNNKSANEKKEILWNKVLSWETDGYISRVDNRPLCCNPMTVATKPDFKTEKIKYRPCIDLSHHVNKYIVDTPTSISHLSTVEDMLLEGDYQTVYDLENMYFQIVMTPEQRMFLGCQIEDPETGTKYFFVFNVMIYGLKHAVTVVTKLLKPIVDYVNTLGIRNSKLIDDGRILSTSTQEGIKNHAIVLDVLDKAGWRIQWTKTDGRPSQTIIYQGQGSIFPKELD